MILEKEMFDIKDTNNTEPTIMKLPLLRSGLLKLQKLKLPKRLSLNSEFGLGEHESFSFIIQYKLEIVTVDSF